MVRKWASEVTAEESVFPSLSLLAFKFILTHFVYLFIDLSRKRICAHKL